MGIFLPQYRAIARNVFRATAAAITPYCCRRHHRTELAPYFGRTCLQHAWQSQVGNDQVTPQDNCIHKALVSKTWVFSRLPSLDEEPHPPTRTPGKRGRYYFRMSRVIRQTAAGTRSCPVSPVDPSFPRAKISRLVFCAQYALHSYHRPGGVKETGLHLSCLGGCKICFSVGTTARQSDKSCMLCLPLTGPTHHPEVSIFCSHRPPRPPGVFFLDMCFHNVFVRPSSLARTRPGASPENEPLSPAPVGSCSVRPDP